jgi:hypothetical protein
MAHLNLLMFGILLLCSTVRQAKTPRASLRRDGFRGRLVTGSTAGETSGPSQSEQ